MLLANTQPIRESLHIHFTYRQTLTIHHLNLNNTAFFSLPADDYIPKRPGSLPGFEYPGPHIAGQSAATADLARRRCVCDHPQSLGGAKVSSKKSYNLHSFVLS